MCLAKAYLDGEKREMLVGEVASLRVEDGRVLLKTLFGEQQEVAAVLKEVDFVSSCIVLEKPGK